VYVRSCYGVCEPGAVLAPAVWEAVGGQESLKEGRSWKKIVDYMYKYAVFDIKLAYNH